MGAHLEPTGTSRRDVLKTGAVGMGALLGAMGMNGVASASPAAQAVGTAAGLTGPVDYFLKLDGVAGESAPDKHRNEIQLLSFSWGVSNPTRAAANGRRTGRPTISDFSFTSTTSKASPTLFADCVTGKNHSTAVITGFRSGGDQGALFLKITLSDVLVSSYQTSASSEVPTDSTALSFRKIEYSIYSQSGTPVTGVWDVVRNSTR